MSNLQGGPWEKGNLTAGTRVEICPYQPNHSHHYLAHLDGEQGVVAGLKGHGDEMKVSVRLAGTRSTVEFPARSVKPLTD